MVKLSIEKKIEREKGALINFNLTNKNNKSNVKIQATVSTKAKTGSLSMNGYVTQCLNEQTNRCIELTFLRKLNM